MSDWRDARSTAELLQWALGQAWPGHEAREVKGLRIVVSADDSAADAYRVEVTNTGRHAFEQLTIDYRDILLWAESFGLDTTHMPAEQQYIAGEPIHIESLAPGGTARFVRKGYRDHEAYDGLRERLLNVEFVQDGQPATKADRRWAPAVVKLPNARREG